MVRIIRETPSVAEAIAKVDQDIIKKSLKEVIESVFSESDTKDPEYMKVLVRRIPILCTNIEAMHKNIDNINDNIKWITRLIIGTVILALLGLVIANKLY